MISRWAGLFFSASLLANVGTALLVTAPAPAPAPGPAGFPTGPVVFGSDAHVQERILSGTKTATELATWSEGHAVAAREKIKEFDAAKLAEEYKKAAPEPNFGGGPGPAPGPAPAAFVE